MPATQTAIAIVEPARLPVRTVECSPFPCGTSFIFRRTSPDGTARRKEKVNEQFER